jgi:hypothetical protein
MWVAIWILGGAIGLSLALPFLGGFLGGDAAEAGFYVGVLIGLPAFLLLLPVLVLAVVVDRAGRHAYPGKPIVATWDVRLSGEDHVVSLPATRISAPDHAWVDGTKIPLAWTPTGVSTARATLDGDTFSGTLSRGYDASEIAASGAFLAVSAVLGGVVGVVPGARYALQVEGAAVEAVPVTEGERRS